MSTYIDVHIIQNIPPSCVNRDDTGSPKSAIYGGVKRLRVSSQAWKRAMRLCFRDQIRSHKIGIRTKRVVEKISEEIAHLLPDKKDQSVKYAVEALNLAADDPKKSSLIKKAALKKEGFPETDALLFFSVQQIKKLATYVADRVNSGKKPEKKKVKDILNSDHPIDIALFGRMLASAKNLDVDASCQVAHAISTHYADSEFDFYTALDESKDEKDNAGAGMMGTIEFSSATMYRYATVNLDLLHENLGDAEATLRALTAFIEAFVKTMPTGKQNTFANRTLPSMVVVQVRDDQPVSLAGAFEKPVRKSEVDGYVKDSVRELVEHEERLEKAFGVKPLSGFFASIEELEELDMLGERVSFPELTGRVRDVVESRLPASE